MGGFFRKVAGAFIYLDEDEGEAKPGAPPQLEPIALETSELLNQLAPAASPGAEPDADTAVVNLAPGAANSVMELTADQVFTAAALTDSPNSAQRVLKLIAGLSMFPKEQQVVMVRAMDAADDGWSEKDVLDDARRRQSALRQHVQAIESEKQERMQQMATNIAATQAESQRALAEIDHQMSELQQRREQTIARSTAELSQLEHHRQRVDESAERARRGITAVINAFSELITFFTGSDPSAVRKP